MTSAASVADAIPAGCQACRLRMRRLGIELGAADYVVALSGNPNTGKSTVFNALTGLKQHVGNWPGKTVGLAEGGMDGLGEGSRFRRTRSGWRGEALPAHRLGRARCRSRPPRPSHRAS